MSKIRNLQRKKPTKKLKKLPMSTITPIQRDLLKMLLYKGVCLQMNDGTAKILLYAPEDTLELERIKKCKKWFTYICYGVNIGTFTGLRLRGLLKGKFDSEYLPSWKLDPKAITEHEKFFNVLRAEEAIGV